MWIKKYALPIFLLYIITSVLLLILFLSFYYLTSLDKLKHEFSSSLITQMMEFQMKLNLNRVLTQEDFSNIADMQINVYDEKNSIFIVKDFENTKFVASSKPLKTMRNIKFSDNIKIKNKSIYMQETVFSKKHGKINSSVYNITLKHTGFEKKNNALLFQIFVIFVTVFLFFIMISYFIIRLSFRPLIEKINSLNSFISDATHEINTPLSVILMSVEMFKTNPNKYLNNIKLASKTLSNLYNDLVYLNLKSETNKFENVDLKKTIEERILYFDIMINEKNLKISANLEDVVFQTDLLKFKKIFDNLFCNAVKYSKENTQISVFLDKRSFCIINSGETISKENIEKIYDKFVRFDKSQGGFGIGLSLVKKYCTELGFKIKCTSENNMTEFKVLF